MPGSLSFRQGISGKLLAAIVLEDLGVFLRDFFQRLQAIGGETGRHHGDAAHAVLRQLRDGLVGVGLQPLVEAEARLERQQQLGGVEAHALAQRIRGCDALRLIGVALVDVFLRHAVERGHDQFGLERQASPDARRSRPPAPRYNPDRRNRAASPARSAARASSPSTRNTSSHTVADVAAEYCG